jgi:pimeloyl-ACP methyl ester carboxylesterase
VARFPPAVWSRLAESGQAYDARAFLASARIPILEVYGDVGRTPETQLRLEVPPNPNITWAWVAGAGHYLPHEKPAEVAEICRRAIERCERDS